MVAGRERHIDQRAWPALRRRSGASVSVSTPRLSGCPPCPPPLGGARRAQLSRSALCRNQHRTVSSISPVRLGSESKLLLRKRSPLNRKSGNSPASLGGCCTTYRNAQDSKQHRSVFRWSGDIFRSNAVRFSGAKRRATLVSDTGFLAFGTIAVIPNTIIAL